MSVRLTAAVLAVAFACAALASCTGDDSVPPPEPRPAVPDVRHLLEHEAASQLEDAGFRVQVEEERVGPCSSVGFVESQEQLEPTSVLISIGMTTALTDCTTDPAAEYATHRLIRHLRGLGPPPRLAMLEGDLDVARASLLLAEGSPLVVTSGLRPILCARHSPAIGFERHVVIGTGRVRNGADGCHAGAFVVSFDGQTRVREVRVVAAPTGQLVTVPAVRGRPVGQARRRLTSLGLEADVSWVRPGRCGETRTVVRQRPHAKTVLEQGQSVGLRTDTYACGPLRRTSSIGADLTAVADALMAFARWETSIAPAGVDVQLYLGNSRIGTVPTSRLSDRRRWRGCPPSDRYGASSCPVNYLSIFVSVAINRFKLEYAADVSPGACLTEVAHAPDLGAEMSEFDVFHITPAREDASCAFDFRYDVYVDAADRIRAVNLLLSEP